MSSPYASAFLFGVALAVAIGPIALLIIRAGIERGAGAGVRCAAGAAVADMLFAFVAALAGSLILPRLTAHRGALAMVSAAVLVAIGLWLIAQAVVAARRPPSERTIAQYGLRATFVLTLVNPLTLVTFASFVGQLALTGNAWQAAGIALAVGSGSFLVAALFALGGAGLGRLLTDRRWILALNLASGLGIVAFGVAGMLK
jgi:threonine/homoserine/homoserine lactone efflux protein